MLGFTSTGGAIYGKVTRAATSWALRLGRPLRAVSSVYGRARWRRRLHRISNAPPRLVLMERCGLGYVLRTAAVPCDGGRRVAIFGDLARDVGPHRVRTGRQTRDYISRGTRRASRDGGGCEGARSTSAPVWRRTCWSCRGDRWSSPKNSGREDFEPELPRPRPGIERTVSTRKRAAERLGWEASATSNRPSPRRSRPMPDYL